FGLRTWSRKGFARRVARRGRSAVDGDKHWILFARIEVRREVDHAVERGLPIGGLEGEHLHLLESKLIELRQVALRQFRHDLAAPVKQSRRWRLVVRL